MTYWLPPGCINLCSFCHRATVARLMADGKMHSVVYNPPLLLLVVVVVMVMVGGFLTAAECTTPHVIDEPDTS